MKSRHNVAIAGLLVLLFGLCAFLLVPKRREQGLAVTFQGWTNVAGVKYAALLFPKVTRQLPGNWFLRYATKWRYALRVEFSYVRNDGTASSGFFEDSGGPSPTTPTTLQVPIPESAAPVKITKAETTLHRYWDYAFPFNLERRFRLRPRTWVFSVPEIPLSDRRGTERHPSRLSVEPVVKRP
jgi:hypothetical protein